MAEASSNPKFDSPELEFPSILLGKRILLATESFGPVNGVSRTTLNLVKYLEKNSVKVAVVAPENSTISKPKLLSTFDENGQMEVRVRGYPLPYNPELSIAYPIRLSVLYGRTFGTRPDLIYLASPASLGFQILYQLRQQRKENMVPVLLNFQTDLSGYCEILFPAPLDAWAVWVFGSVQSYLFRHPSVRTVFYPSKFVLNYLQHASIQPEKMQNLRRGVDAYTFHPSKRSPTLRSTLAPNGELILMACSRVAPEKGFEFLAACAHKLDARGLRYKLIVVGGNRNAQVENDVKALFGSLLEKGKVTFLGFLRGEELARAYACGDVFLHCSITETFGLVVLEAMASGVPVIARDEGGPSEIVAQGASGYLVAPGDLDGFTERVMQLAGDVELRKSMGWESRRMAEEQTWDRIGNQVAWKLAEVLEANTDNEMEGQRKPVDGVLRRVARAVLSDLGMLGDMLVIFGVWAGLVVTWVLVKTVLFFKSLASR